MQTCTAYIAKTGQVLETSEHSVNFHLSIAGRSTKNHLDSYLCVQVKSYMHPSATHIMNQFSPPTTAGNEAVFYAASNGITGGYAN